MRPTSIILSTNSHLGCSSWSHSVSCRRQFVCGSRTTSRKIAPPRIGTHPQNNYQRTITVTPETRCVPVRTPEVLPGRLSSINLQWRHFSKTLGVDPSPPISSPLRPLPSPPSLPFPLEVGLLNPASGSGGAL